MCHRAAATLARYVERSTPKCLFVAGGGILDEDAKLTLQLTAGFAQAIELKPDIPEIPRVAEAMAF